MGKGKIILIILAVALALFGIYQIGGKCADGGSDGENSGKTESIYSASDILYVSEAGTVITITASYRDYKKTNGGTVAVALAYINGYTGPVLVGRSPNSVAYSYNYFGDVLIDKYGTVNVDGIDWYYSAPEGFIGGNQLDFKNKMSVYCSSKTTSEEVAKELIAILDKEKLGKEISTVEQLKAIANSSENFVLKNDIDLGEEDNWQPIVNFSGYFGGNGHSIKNLKIAAANTENIGLFANLSGTVDNLKIEDASISARGDAGKAGIVAGTNKGLISGVTVSGSLTPKYYGYVGGLAGYNDSGIIKKCTNTATVNGADNVGGIVGYAVVKDDNAVTSCVNEGVVEGKNKTGGIVGYLTCENKNKTFKIENNKNKNTVTGAGSVGGVIGEVYAYAQSRYENYFAMSLLTNEAEVTGSSSGESVGGIVGKAERLASLSTCENSADITGGVYVGGLAGYAPGTAINASGAVNNNTITGKGKIGGFAGYAGVIEGAVNNGEIVLTGVVVEDGNSRAYVGGIAGFCSGLIGCENNADIRTDRNADFVGGLAGYISVSNDNCVNDNVNSGAVAGYDRVGGIAGYLTCDNKNKTFKAENNVNKNTVTGRSCVGGIFGEVYAYSQYYYSSRYENYFAASLLTNEAEVTGSSAGQNVGGLIGKATRLTTLTACENAADITGGVYVGGFVGYAPDTNVKGTGAENNNTITGNYAVGGFAGYAGVIENAVNKGEVIAIGKDEKGQSYLGGIAGYCSGVIGCENNADIGASDIGDFVGGIAGYIVLSDTHSLRENINNGKIVGKNYVGGIAGYVTCVMSNATYRVENNENKNVVRGEKFAGGITGYVRGFYASNIYDYTSYFEIVNCINEEEIIGTEKVGGICGGYENLKTDENLMDTNTTLYGEKLGR